MLMTKRTLNIKLKKIKGKITYLSRKEEKEYSQFLSNVQEGEIVEIFMNISKEDGSLSQLAKLHILIKKLASFTGLTVKEIKLVIKSKCGLCFGEGEDFQCKSFSECSSEELSLAIQECILFGDSINCHLE